MSRIKEPKRHRAMVEGGLTHLTYWRVLEADELSKLRPAPPWVDPWGSRHYWEQIPDPIRLVFKGEKPR